MRIESFMGPREEASNQMAGVMLANSRSSSFEEQSEGIHFAERSRSIQAALWRVFESEGRRVTITFDRESGNSSIGELQTAVSASVVLPFGWDELVARVDLIRKHVGADNQVFRFGDVRVDLFTMEVRRGSGQRVDLTAQEFKTLKLLLLNPGKVFSREELLNQAWGYENYPCTRTVDNHILRLRQKLEVNPAEPVHFRTVVRVGYKFIPVDEEAEQQKGTVAKAMKYE